MLEYNGKKYVRVSEILSPFSDFSLIDKEVLERKCKIGTQVHDAIADDIKGDLPFVGADAIGYFNSFEKWRSYIDPVFVESEMRYYCHKKMITGCIDALIKLEGEKEAVLVDFKTSAQESPSWRLQGHLYHYLLGQNGKNTSRRFLFLKLDKNGDFPKVFQYTVDVNTLSLCMQAIRGFWEKNVDYNSGNCVA